MRRFISRLLAAGLSAGVVLVWWPHVFSDTDSAASWVARGLFWTLISELLAMGLGPLEELFWTQTRAGRALAAGAARLHERALDDAPVRRRTTLVCVVALTTLALPIGLIAQGQPVAPATPPAVVRVTKVVRPVTVRRVTTTVQQAPSAAGVGAADAAAPTRTVTTVVRGADRPASAERQPRGEQVARGGADRPSRTTTAPQTTGTTGTPAGVDGPSAAAAAPAKPPEPPAAGGAGEGEREDAAAPRLAANAALPS
ncbi:hypothetical protein [Patulibacter sp. SYSU D01012]|uniref:hypothetical protein n=1 Tax=Patulibacter sp. SYSU D01012 TaxID=2817381 RepID=UPI001B30455B|nr:hypothetical protein [Patulibacter sp. SYSU D01012]